MASLLDLLGGAVNNVGGFVNHLLGADIPPGADPNKIVFTNGANTVTPAPTKLPIPRPQVQPQGTVPIVRPQTQTAAVPLNVPRPQVQGTTDFQRPDPAAVEQAIRQGYQAYSKLYAGGQSLPAEKYIPMFVEATQKYPVFAQNPYLLPQISILETSAGRNVTRNNNLLNWGARLQKAGKYNPATFEEAINAAIKGIGGDSSSGSAGYYEPFRQSNDPTQFARIYEPTNNDYGRSLTEGINFFKQFEGR